LGYIFEAAEVADPSDKSSMFYRIRDFVSKDLIPPTASQPGGEVTLAYRIVREIQSLGNSVAKADAARKGARTSTIAPSAQGGLCYPVSMFCWLTVNSRNDGFSGLRHSQFPLRVTEIRTTLSRDMPFHHCSTGPSLPQ
jgi:hypothetical protein